MVAETEVGFIVRVQQIGVELLLHHLVGNSKFGLSLIHSADSKHTEIIEQAHEIVGIHNVGSRKAFF